MKADIFELKTSLATTQRDTGDRLRLLEARLKRLELVAFRGNADTNLERESLLTQISQLETQLEEAQKQRAAVPIQGPATEPKNLGRADYVAFITPLYKSKKYEQVIATCEDFLSNYPDDKQFTAQILYWRGDSNYELGEHRKSILSFQELLTRFPTFSKIPEVLYKIGMSLDALKYSKDADTFYEEVIKKYPKSSFANKAKEQLKAKEPPAKDKAPKESKSG